MDEQTRKAEAAAEAAKQRQNLIVLAVVVLILGVGGWLVDRLLTYRKIQNCIEAHHKNCVPIDLPARQ
ncbi:MAG: hypothetical protein JSS20_07530 [Proteobacteria bacterium]|nr:hypothetical protein [Pseudomonadota bacterium]